MLWYKNRFFLILFLIGFPFVLCAEHRLNPRANKALIGLNDPFPFEDVTLITSDPKSQSTYIPGIQKSKSSKQKTSEKKAASTTSLSQASWKAGPVVGKERPGGAKGYSDSSYQNEGEEKGKELKLEHSDIDFPGQIKELVIQGELSDYPSEKKVDGFVGYQQTGAVSCGPNAVRNSLEPITGVLYNDSQLFPETVAKDHEGLKPLEDELRSILGGADPRMLSSRGTTPIGNAQILTKYLAENETGLKGAFAAIPNLEDRVLVIVDNINKNRPVMVPTFSGATGHWVTAYGYDLNSRTIYVSNGSKRAMSFEQFDSLNSFATAPGGTFGEVLDLAKEHGLGANVLLFATEKGEED